MPYSVKNKGQLKDMRERLEKTYTSVSDEDVRQAIHVFNGTYKSTKDEGRSWASTYSTLNKKLTKKASREYLKGPGIVLSRLGGWSPKKQAPGSAPENSGTWAFIFPHFEPFLVGSTDEVGITNGDRPSRYQLMKDNQKKTKRDPSLAMRRARYTGPIYCRLNIPGCKYEEDNGWCLTDADTLRKYVFGRQRVEDYAAEARRHQRENSRHPKYRPLKRTDMPRYSKDHYEVFIPATGGKFSPFNEKTSSAERVASRFLTSERGSS